MTALLVRSPLQSLPTAMNRPTTRRRSQKQAFEEEDAPVAKRAKTEVNGAGRRTTAAVKQSAKVAYNESDDGFQFTRRTTRRTAKTQPAAEPIPEEPAKPKPAPARRKKNALDTEDEEQAEQPQKRRRSARLSGEKEQLEPPRPNPKPTKKTAPPENRPENRKRKEVTPAAEHMDPNPFAGVRTPKHTELHVAKKRGNAATKIMLPFADTPVITRNKEMRKGGKDGHRRSSTGLRGRRASSLIDSGMSNALPHSDVEVCDFYKLIEQSLPEPRRMRQLLTWCGSRALPEKPSGNVRDANAILAARSIQQELIDDFQNKPELTDWFTREETIPAPVVKKPNPVNEKNQIALKELEEEVKRLEEEQAAWESISSSALTPPPPPSLANPFPTLSSIDTSLLDPSQAAILTTLRTQTQQPPDPSDSTQQPQPHPPTSTFKFTFTTPESLNTHLSNLALSLEPNIDQLADGLHKIQQFRNTAERVADRVLCTAAKKLEERDKERKEEAGTQGIGVGDVLRGLAGVLRD
ncbi:hypothetical protein M011DRAFT_468986 [Sporormia fimetaria CBS 119925]|uniref:Mis12-Mtw1 family protein n=1 Tax=Sporormia fimetaria CBS 119925 TaxID=1340428 RepID=A0A6A6VAF1_9PLEO|nr:hypothetical protein M011DRAFT_468986 [Sporormia fimetaria CBS 119925]